MNLLIKFCNTCSSTNLWIWIDSYALIALVVKYYKLFYLYWFYLNGNTCATWIQTFEFKLRKKFVVHRYVMHILKSTLESRENHMMMQ